MATTIPWWIYCLYRFLLLEVLEGFKVVSVHTQMRQHSNNGRNLQFYHTCGQHQRNYREDIGSYTTPTQSHITFPTKTVFKPIFYTEQWPWKPLSGGGCKAWKDWNTLIEQSDTLIQQSFYWHWLFLLLTWHLQNEVVLKALNRQLGVSSVLHVQTCISLLRLLISDEGYGSISEGFWGHMICSTDLFSLTVRLTVLTTISWSHCQV